MSAARTKRRTRRISQPHGAVTTETVAWLWPGRIPIGLVTLFAGKTDAGKSLVVDDVAARVSVGADWPDGAGPAPRGEVLIFGEDPIASVQNPRLLAAGGDLARIRHWRAPSFVIDHQLNHLKADLKAHPATKLVVFDPVGDYLIASTYTKVRRVLGELRDLALKHEVAVLGVGHPPKGQPASLDAFGGSRGIVSSARAMWLVVKDENDRRLLLWGKCNLSRVRTGLEFESANVQVHGRIEAPRVSDAPVEMTADDWWVLEQQRIKAAAGRPRGAQAEAKEFLEEFLKDGPKPAAEVLAGAAEREIRRGSLHRAKESLKIKVEKQTTADGPWVWTLPPPKQEPASVSAQQRQDAEPAPPKTRRCRKGNNVVPFEKKQQG